MRKLYQSENKPLMLKICVQNNTPAVERIHLKVYDPKRKNTVYTDRYHDFVGKSNFYVRMPTSPMFSCIEIYNQKNGNMPEGKDKSFSLVPNKNGQTIETLPLPIKIEGLENMNPEVYDFVAFAQYFCERAGGLSTGTYFSKNGKFRIDYLPVIKDQSGRELRTPARISTGRGIMEVSQKHFVGYTVPKRFAILCHEYSHVYENTNAKDEVEADLNGLLIYLGLGYPRIEAHQAFLDVFKNSPSDLNRHRYEVLSKFIDRFDNFNFKLQQPSKGE